MATATAPTLTPDQVVVVLDACGREAILLPDDVAAALREHRDRDYTDMPAIADGYSVDFAPGTWVHTTLTTIMDAYGASRIPEGLSPDDAWLAGQDRYRAARHRGLWPFLVGSGDFDPDTRWWRDYQANKHLHVGCAVSSTDRGYHWRG